MSKKILVIDDEQDVVDFQKSYLERRGYAVFVATSACEALEIIQKESPDVVFCDVRMEKEASSGLDILEQAKKINPNIVFYIITGFIDKEIQERGAALGAKEILTKPISNAEFERRIKEAVS